MTSASETASSTAAVGGGVQAILPAVAVVADGVIAEHAREVDRDARFPKEALDALRQERLLAAYIPTGLGGLGLSVSELYSIAERLAYGCASTAMVWAMHQIQVACLVHHASGDAFFRSYLEELADAQLLLASATSEAGVGGDIRRSIAAVGRIEEGAALDKAATTVSYGASADGYLVTARRDADSDAGDQVLVLLKQEQAELKQTGTWDTLGMRGTCSPGFRISGRFHPDQILSEPFSTIATETMVPMSHILWSAVWNGLAADAVRRARTYLRKKARGTQELDSQSGDHLSAAFQHVQLARATARQLLSTYTEELRRLGDKGDGDAFSAGFTIEMNNLKLSTSQLAVNAIEQALAVCGMAGYSEASPFSVARHLRDAYSARLMISNDRLSSINGRLLLMHSD